MVVAIQALAAGQAVGVTQVGHEHAEDGFGAGEAEVGEGIAHGGKVREFAADQGGIEGDLVAEDVHEVSVELTGPVESTGSLWDPIPITAPTYVSQPLAPRTVRTIDLSAPVASGSVVPVTADRPDDFGRVDAGRTDAGAAPERRRASGE